MNLYRVYNGYTGNSNINILIVADNSELAEIIAKEKFKRESNEYGENYYNNLSVDLIFEDLSKAHQGDIEG
jgi:hypothetical protein